MSNSINDTFYNRIVLQTIEAELCGDINFHDMLMKAASTQSIRSNEDEKIYSYSDLELWKDCKSLVAQAAIRAADYYGNINVDFKSLDPDLNGLTSHLFKTLASKLGNKLIGAYEPKLPGEKG